MTWCARWTGLMDGNAGRLQYAACWQGRRSSRLELERLPAMAREFWGACSIRPLKRVGFVKPVARDW